MKDGSKTACVMGTVEPYLAKEKSTKVNFKKIQCMASGCSIGPTVVYMKETGCKTKSVEKVSTFGQTDKYMKEILRKTIVRDLAFFIIQMAKSSKVIGVREKNMVQETTFSRMAAFFLWSIGMAKKLLRVSLLV